MLIKKGQDAPNVATAALSEIKVLKACVSYLLQRGEFTD